MLEDARSIRDGLWRIAQLAQDAAETPDARIQEEDLDGRAVAMRCARRWTPTRTDALVKAFSGTLREGPEMELACVIVPIQTENRVHFSALLQDGAPEVSFERATL
jgi:hypothetical protein